MKFRNKHLQHLSDGREEKVLTGREGVDFFLAERDDDVARWDPEKASMVFTSDELLIACKMIQVDLATTQQEFISSILSAENEEG